MARSEVAIALRGGAASPVVVGANQDLYRSTLKQALTALGGDRAQLAKSLAVQEWEVRQWLQGAEDIPQRIFLKAADLVLAASMEELRKSRGPRDSTKK
jgi:maltooligosyltrehalose synthase